MWFLLALTVLGTGARVVKGRAEPVVTVASDSAALVAQIRAVDSAVGVRQSGKAPRKAARSTRRATATGDRPSRAIAPEAAAAALDISAIPQARGMGASRPPSERFAGKGARVDLDVAAQAEIEALPWVGPALATRIIENRKRCGPFASLEGLTRVPGIGSGTARRLAERVTFSGTLLAPSTTPSTCK